MGIQSWIRVSLSSNFLAWHDAGHFIISFKIWRLDKRQIDVDSSDSHREKSSKNVASPFQSPGFWKKGGQRHCRRFFQEFNWPKLDLYWSKLNSSNKFSKGSMLFPWFLWEVAIHAESLNHVKKNDGSTVSISHAHSDRRMWNPSERQSQNFYPLPFPEFWLVNNKWNLNEYRLLCIDHGRSEIGRIFGGLSDLAWKLSFCRFPLGG